MQLEYTIYTSTTKESQTLHIEFNLLEEQNHTALKRSIKVKLPGCELASHYLPARTR